ncbi:hypothetical protein PHMEG_00027120 [Phytophthora megakarya]|uniref:Uncharacterized protein n=1 Tax=Phytophthora megakarya TaxID=4795 RepID=A0A225VAK2_9STRA|nr:hypothetical protein PHMEG_00027120 [Phytophthora megakarya]
MPCTGRKRRTGNGSIPKTFKRMAVSYHFKLQVLQYLDGHTMEETISHFYPGLLRGQFRSKKRVCYAWKDSRALIEAKCAVGLGRHHRDRSRGLRTSLPIAAEAQLVRWVNDPRSDGVPATCMQKQRCRPILSPRRGREKNTSYAVTGCQFVVEHEKAKQHLKMQARGLKTLMKELKISKVYNADQTGVNYEYIPETTVNAKGVKTVWVKSAGKTKGRVIAMLLIDSDGNKAEPFLVFKTRSSKLAAKPDRTRSAITVLAASCGANSKANR